MALLNEGVLLSKDMRGLFWNEVAGLIRLHGRTVL